MSIYQGARLRTTRLPAASFDTARPAVSHRAVSRPSVPHAHTNGRAIILVGIVVALTILGFVYLTSTLGANASSAEISRLATVRTSYQQQLLTHRALIVQAVDVGDIEDWAITNGLVRLEDPLIVRLP